MFVLMTFHFLFLYALAVPNVADEVYGAMSMCVDLAMGKQEVSKCPSATSLF